MQNDCMMTIKMLSIEQDNKNIESIIYAKMLLKGCSKIDKPNQM